MKSAEQKSQSVINVSELKSSNGMLNPSSKQVSLGNVSLDLFKKNNNTLSNFNTQMSNTLRDSITHLDDICIRIKSCLDDIARNNQRYEMLKQIPDSSLELIKIPSNITLHQCENLLDLSSQTKVASDDNNNNDGSLTSEAELKAVPKIETENQALNKKVNSKTQRKLNYLRKSIDQIPPGNKKERLMQLLSYKFISNQGKIDIIDHLKKRAGCLPCNTRNSGRNNKNVIEMPKKNTRFIGPYYIDDR